MIYSMKQVTKIGNVILICHTSFYRVTLGGIYMYMNLKIVKGFICCGHDLCTVRISTHTQGLCRYRTYHSLSIFCVCYPLIYHTTIDTPIENVRTISVPYNLILWRSCPSIKAVTLLSTSSHIFHHNNILYVFPCTVPQPLSVIQACW